MGIHSVLKRLERLTTRLARERDAEANLAPLRQDPADVLRRAGLIPDIWQANVLHSSAARMLLLANRQAGKSSVAAAVALQAALVRPQAPVLLLSPTLRQSGELFRKVAGMFHAVGRPVAAIKESALGLELANGSRIVCLPGAEGTVRGFSGVALLVIDEAARVRDELYYAVRPMLAVSQGRLMALSTPFGKRGWFYEAWSGNEDWQRVQVTARQCPRITPAFLDEERRAMGERWFRQEYFCSFEDAVGQLIPQADIDAAFEGGKNLKPLWPQRG
jgi:hypothetical protein